MEFYYMSRIDQLEKIILDKIDIIQQSEKLLKDKEAKIKELKDKLKEDKEKMQSYYDDNEMNYYKQIDYILNILEE